MKIGKFIITRERDDEKTLEPGWTRMNFNTAGYLNSISSAGGTFRILTPDGLFEVVDYLDSRIIAWKYI